MLLSNKSENFAVKRSGNKLLALAMSSILCCSLLPHLCTTSRPTANPVLDPNLGTGVGQAVTAVGAMPPPKPEDVLLERQTLLTPRRSRTFSHHDKSDDAIVLWDVQVPKDAAMFHTAQLC
jgi:hypothetical protein